MKNVQGMGQLSPFQARSLMHNVDVNVSRRPVWMRALGDWVNGWKDGRCDGHWTMPDSAVGVVARQLKLGALVTTRLRFTCESATNASHTRQILARLSRRPLLYWPDRCYSSDCFTTATHRRSILRPRPWTLRRTATSPQQQQ